ncbi:MAG: hypothetical protein QNI86_06550 [Halieaceae bacterium]|nr:hypothetical protein [Halieaceae bacterium]
MEATNSLLMVLGVAVLLASWVVLLIASWKEDYSWGLCTVLLPPLSYIYALFRLDKAGEAISLAVVGWILLFLAF